MFVQSIGIRRLFSVTKPKAPATILFLGNPGLPYKNTRHSVGHLFFSYLQTTPLGKGRASQGAGKSVVIEKADCKLVCSAQFMNLSGRAISRETSPKDLLVVCDDLDIKQFGCKLRQEGGGLRGHNGLRSVSSRLGSKSFAQLLLGVGRPNSKEPADVSAWVLGRFSPEELRQLKEKTFPEAKNLLEGFLKDRQSAGAK